MVLVTSHHLSRSTFTIHHFKQAIEYWDPRLSHQLENVGRQFSAGKGRLLSPTLQLLTVTLLYHLCPHLVLQLLPPLWPETRRIPPDTVQDKTLSDTTLLDTIHHHRDGVG